MKKLFMISQLFIAMILTLSCEKVVEVDVPPQLEVVVIDSEGNSVEGAEICLYQNLNDFKAEENLVKKVISKDGGTALFQELLTEVIYYIRVKKQDKDNLQTETHIEYALSNNIKTKVTVILK